MAGPRFTFRASTIDGHRPLTDRELDVMRLVADGLTNKQIGDRLALSPLTVKSHLARVADALGTHGDRAGMVATLFRRGVLA